MKMIRKTVVLLLAILLCALPFAVYAHDVPDMTKSGTITVELQYDGKNVEGGALSIFRMGDVHEEDGNYSFVLSSAFAGSGQSLEKPESADVAAKLWQYAQDKAIAADQTAENASGKVVFSDLTPGLYLLVQPEPSPGYHALSPFLVSLPVWDEETGAYQYEVSAAGKLELRPMPGKPSEPATPTAPPGPTDPTLPQTGQLNWPVPVLVILGLALFAGGWLLRFGKRKGGYEK